jgi:ATP-dependent Clp protease protease subunit
MYINRFANARTFSTFEEEEIEVGEEEETEKESDVEEEEKEQKPEEKDADSLQTMPNPGVIARESGVIMLSGDFNRDNILPIIGSIYEYNLMPQEMQPERLTLVINSPGGRVDYCKMLLDTMWMSTIPVDTLASGIAMSCGVITLMAGQHRMATANSEIMSHQYAGGVGGKEHEIFGAMKSHGMMSRWIEDHYKECTGLSRRKIRKKLLSPTDFFMSAKEAKKYNIIDEVVPTKRQPESIEQ